MITRLIVILIMAVAVATTISSSLFVPVYAQLQRSMVTGAASPTAVQIIDSVKAECAKTIEFQPDPQIDLESVLVDSCLFLLYESATTVVLNGDLLINQSPGVHIDNPFIWQAADEFKTQGYIIDSVSLAGQGSRGNPHELYV